MSYLIFAVASVIMLGLAVRAGLGRVPRFVIIVLAVECVLAVGALGLSGRFAALVWAGQGCLGLHLWSLLRGHGRNTGWRLLISLPASWFMAAAFLAAPWSAFLWLPDGPPLPWVPFALAGVGLLQSLTARRETVVYDLSVPARAPGREGGPVWHPKGVRRRLGFNRQGDPGLRIIQIADPHLGPFMSEHRLHRLCKRAVAARPDLILITGDLLTREHNQDAEGLTRGLAPLRNHGRVFACLGNHDHEAMPLVRRVLRDLGVTLLVDAATVVNTPAGDVQILGLDHRFQGRAEQMPAIFRAWPRVPGMLRLVLLHDPGAFRFVPDGEADLVFSGHTHGGQLGLVSLGLPWTIVRLLSPIPDHGPWAMGSNRLYVHRAQGHYGFPLRLGVPSEESVLVVAPRPVS